MGFYLNPGNEAFRISVSSEIYVDKSELIAFTNRRLGQEKRFICVSRPRRFGKSMTANMLCAYYGRECDSAELFKGLKIEKDPVFMRHLNQYDVIFLNIQQFLRSADDADYLTENLEQKVLGELKEVFAETGDFSTNSLPEALAGIFARDRRPERGFVFIIDEWDCLFREARDNKRAQRKYLDFLRDLFKDRIYVKLVYMTGILPVKKYGTHSALNIFDEFSMTDPDVLADFVGFTESEVRELCLRYGKDFEEARRWYDGYQFTEHTHIYNPKSIVDSMYGKKFRSFWTGTETYEALKIYIDMNYDGLRDAVTSMLGGVGCEIDTGTFQNDMTSFQSRDDVLTLLVHLGYLTYQDDLQQVFIPNEEVRGEFVRAVKSSGWDEVIHAVAASGELLEATLRGDTEAVARGIDNVHMENTSILSYNNENSLSCVITLAYFSARRDYQLIREFPSGKGFADVVFLPRKKVDKPALVVELKWDQSAQGAVRQIRQNRYVEALKDYQGKILLVGINYNKKTKKHQCIIEDYLKK